MSDHTSFLTEVQSFLALEESSNVCLSKNKSLKESKPTNFSSENLENNGKILNENLSDSFIDFSSNLENITQDEISLPEKVVKAVTFNPAGNLVVPIKINGVPLRAVIDTAAQVSLLNKKIMDNYFPDLNLISNIKLKGIEPDRSILAEIRDDVSIELGENSYTWRLISTDIQEDCLLGLDFLAFYRMDVLLSENVLAIGNERIPMECPNNDRKFTLRHVSLNKNVTIPAQSGVKFPVKIHSKFHDGEQPLLFEAIQMEK